MCVYMCVFERTCNWFNARSSGPGAGGNSFGTPQEHPGPVFGSSTEPPLPCHHHKRESGLDGAGVVKYGEETRFRFTEKAYWH